jgi:hypothetical protein
MTSIKIKRDGYGQVEPNHLSAQRNGQIYAQLPADENIDLLENGQFVKYDYAAGKVALTGNGSEYMLVYNEEKLYDERKQSRKDFAMKKEDYVGGIMTPRVFKTNIGDIYTTNCIGDGTAEITLEVGDKLIVDTTNGYLKKDNTASEGMIWQVAVLYTMPDGQNGVKLQRIN